MTQKPAKTSAKQAAASQDREARLKAALKGNMAKRKAQTRARTQPSAANKNEQE